VTPSPRHQPPAPPPHTARQRHCQTHHAKTLTERQRNDGSRENVSDLSGIREEVPRAWTSECDAVRRRRCLFVPSRQLACSACWRNVRVPGVLAECLPSVCRVQEWRVDRPETLRVKSLSTVLCLCLHAYVCPLTPVFVCTFIRVCTSGWELPGESCSVVRYRSGSLHAGEG